MNEIGKPIKDMKTEFNKKVELLKKSQPEMMPEVKGSISQIKPQWKDSLRG